MPYQCPLRGPRPSENAIKELRKFTLKLSKAIKIAGGMGDQEHIESLLDSPLRNSFHHLFPNGIVITFEVEKRLKSRKDKNV